MILFSYFKNGLTQTTPDKNIDLPHLISLIKHHPDEDKIQEIRRLRIQGNQQYKQLKLTLPYITGNCLVKKRSINGDLFQENFICGSGYVYIDIDRSTGDIQSYKSYFINRYQDIVSMVCISSGGGGIGVLVKVSNVINTKEEFIRVWNLLTTNYFKDEVVDTRTNDLGRGFIISSDMDVFVNYDNCISIDTRLNNNSGNKKGINQLILIPTTQYRLIDTFSNNIPIEHVLTRLITKTPVEVDNPIVDIKPVPFVDIKFPQIIVDSTKHQLFTGMIHALVYLNPDLPVAYIFNYIKFINYQFGKPPMEFKKLIDLFRFQISVITKEPGYVFTGLRTKWVHFHPDCGLSGEEKKHIASRINGQIKRMNRIQRIEDARIELLSNNEKVTQKTISQLTGISLPTVKRHWNKPPINLEEISNTYNCIQISRN